MKKPTYLLLIAILFLAQCSTSETDPVQPVNDDPVVDDPVSEDPVQEIQIPTIETVAISEISKNSARTGGNITDDGGADITARGICWSLEAEPTLENDYTEDGTGLGSFESDLMDLKQGTTYYVRAYATNSEGTAYGNEVSFTTTTLPDKIFEGDLLLTTQTEVDDFGIQEYTEVNGKLTIQGITFTEIINLDGLENLRKVTGDFESLYNEEITDLGGLRNLQSVTGDFKIWGSFKLESFEGLSSLNEAGGLNIQGNRTLTDISALSGITELRFTSLVIFLNDALQSLNGLQNITSVEGGVSITSNDNLLNLDGLSSLQTIGAVLGISRNPSLENIDGLAELQSVEMNFEIFENETLESLNGINNLIECGNLYIHDNASLISVNGFNSLANINRVGGLDIDLNPSLLQINGFANLSTVSSDFRITTNTNLREINGFNNLEMAGIDLEISWNINLETLNTFNELTMVGADLVITSNNDLISFTGFEKLVQANTLEIRFNSSLTDLCGLSNIIDNGFSGNYSVNNNAFNPTQNDIEAGNCAQ